MSNENTHAPQAEAEGAAGHEVQSPDLTPELSPQEQELAQLRDKVAKLEAKLAEARDEMLRAVADLQNVRRRTELDARQARETAAAEIAAKLLPVLDNFERTMAAAEAGASLEAVLEGVALIDRQMREVLEHHNVRPILALGQSFDPTLHEAVLDEHSEHEEGTVIGEIEKGYLIGDKVLRPAKVKVSKGKPE